MQKPAISPRQFLLAFALFFFSGIPVVVIAVVVLSFAFKTVVAVEAPGSKELRLEPGSYTVYWESPETNQKNMKAPGVQVRVEPKEGGPPVTVSSVGDMVTSYTTLNSAGVSFSEFTIAKAGEYRVSATAPARPPPYPGQVAVSKTIRISGILLLVLAAVVFPIGGVVAGLIVLLRRPKPAATPA